MKCVRHPCRRWGLRTLHHETDVGREKAKRLGLRMRRLERSLPSVLEIKRQDERFIAAELGYQNENFRLVVAARRRASATLTIGSLRSVAASSARRISLGVQP